jgi:hydrogenase maturation protein HypF
MSAVAQPVRVRARVDGTVQGVGFRPYVYRLANELGLEGFVLNDERGVLVEVQGDEPAVRRFLVRLPAEAPPLARVENVRAAPIAPTSPGRGFEIAGSARAGGADVPVTPDATTCQDCLEELFDASDRRYRYPFINCTNCGPRFTIVRGIPYDRPRTTMAAFRMCPRCQAEYEDPLDRRFHAQPNACPECGPSLTLVDAGGAVQARRDDALREAATALAGGAIVAVKGLGGYHLACAAADEDAVRTLRARKHREEKPLALMVRDLDGASELIELTERELPMLTGPQRPIVIAPRRDGAPVAASVAPRSRELGVMLAYTPLHHLLLADVGEPLVMTSGNVSDEPIAYRDDDARERLAGIADLLLVHDRPIETRTDDSVVRCTRHRPAPLMVRRSRGYVPAAIELPVPARRPVLACGAELKSTFCLARGRRAWLSHHIGDLETWEVLRSFAEGIEHFERLFEIAPEVIAHDLHPDYMSTRFALQRADVELVSVQHHHAHLAACLAEHGVLGRAAGALYDGTGYGTDGTIWGGELLAGDMREFVRAGHLWPVRLPGGAQAVREPWRMACAWLVAAAGVDVDPPPAIASLVAPERWRAVARMAASGIASPVTTSAGRLFDAIAAVCGIRATVSYEGQAAVELEGACDPAERGAYPLPVCTGAEKPLVLDARPTVLSAVRDACAGESAGVISARFHDALARATASALLLLADRQGVEVVVLSGGTFQNRVLLERVTATLRRSGLRVLTPALLPPGDGGISYGQAAIAAARMEAM